MSDEKEQRQKEYAKHLEAICEWVSLRKVHLLNGETSTVRNVSGRILSLRPRCLEMGQRKVDYRRTTAIISYPEFDFTLGKENVKGSKCIYNKSYTAISDKDGSTRVFIEIPKGIDRLNVVTEWIVYFTDGSSECVKHHQDFELIELNKGENIYCDDTISFNKLSYALRASHIVTHQTPFVVLRDEDGMPPAVGQFQTSSELVNKNLQRLRYECDQYGTDHFYSKDCLYSSSPDDFRFDEFSSKIRQKFEKTKTKIT